jgi:uncharacterized protein YkwD
MFKLSILSLVFLVSNIYAASVSQSILESAYLKGLVRHNELRAKHATPVLTLDVSLNDKAQKYAQYLADNSQFQHSNDALSGQVGENLYYTCSYPTTPDVESNL